jgi:hypothetical protein
MRQENVCIPIFNKINSIISILEKAFGGIFWVYPSSGVKKELDF